MWSAPSVVVVGAAHVAVGGADPGGIAGDVDPIPAAGKDLAHVAVVDRVQFDRQGASGFEPITPVTSGKAEQAQAPSDRKSTRLNSSHVKISYAVFCLK